MERTVKCFLVCLNPIFSADLLALTQCFHSALKIYKSFTRRGRFFRPLFPRSLLRFLYSSILPSCLAPFQRGPEVHPKSPLPQRPHEKILSTRRESQGQRRREAVTRGGCFRREMPWIIYRSEMNRGCRHVCELAVRVY